MTTVYKLIAKFAVQTPIVYVRAGGIDEAIRATVNQMGCESAEYLDTVGESHPRVDLVAQED